MVAPDDFPAVPAVPAEAVPFIAETAPVSYAVNQLLPMLHRFLGESPCPVTTLELLEHEELQQATTVFLHKLFNAACVFRQHDPASAQRDLQVVQLKLSGKSTEEIVKIALPGQIENVSHSRRNGRINQAINRFPHALDNKPGYMPHEVLEAYKRFLAGDTDALPLPTPILNEVSISDSAPVARERPGNVELMTLQTWLRKGELRLANWQLHAIGRYLLEAGTVPAADREGLAAGLQAIGQKITVARAYEPRFHTQVFNEKLRLRPTDTELIEPVLTFDETSAANGFSRMRAEADDAITNTELRERILRNIRRIVVISSPDDPSYQKRTSRPSGRY